MRSMHEFTLELTAQELLDPPDLKRMLQADATDLTEIASAAAPASSAPAAQSELEIELTSEEIDALLEAR